MFLKNLGFLGATCFFVKASILKTVVEYLGSSATQLQREEKTHANIKDPYEPTRISSNVKDDKTQKSKIAASLRIIGISRLVGTGDPRSPAIHIQTPL